QAPQTPQAESPQAPQAPQLGLATQGMRAVKLPPLFYEPATRISARTRFEGAVFIDGFPTGRSLGPQIIFEVVLQARWSNVIRQRCSVNLGRVPGNHLQLRPVWLELR